MIRLPSFRSAFTLIELMVVIGIIALVAVGLGRALTDTGGNSLATGQTTLAALVSTARAQAAVGQTETRLMVYATRPPAGDAEKFLRLLQVFRAEPQGSNTWVPVGAAVVLPRGIYVVPTSTAGLLAAGVTWPTNPPLLSTLGNPFNPGQAAGTPFGNSTAYFLQFNADGSIQQMGTQAYARLLVATAVLSNNVPQFNNAGAVRGLLIRPSGGVTFANDANSF
ncbi:Tfp pilus assembly protein FimT/FimU [Horticoccus sp. 23ND18S-11]|uniref:Tfp pilus assembly protein FimT/FimU n=1 Tax=Horticoccus sp. 23ND18S-11 TaxID=3391832 RepID=UPI0039C92642